MPEATVTWVKDKQFVGQSGSGHAVVMDTGPEVGGHNTGATPMEMLLMALGGCTAVDVVFILGDRMKQTVSGCSVRAEGKRAETPPKVYTEIDVHYRVSGPGLSVKKAIRAVRLSAQNFCSVSLMLEKAATITSHYAITDDETGETTSGVLEE